jgi:rubredoxin
MEERFRCLSCGHPFPWFPTDRGEPSCPACGGTRLERNPWLLGTGEGDVTAEEHLAVALEV